MILDLFLYVLIGVIFYTWILYRTKLSNKIIDEWLKENNFKIINKKYKLLFKGIFERGSLMTVVYRIDIKNENNEIKKCWFKIGNSYTGMLFNKNVSVRWI